MKRAAYMEPGLALLSSGLCALAVPPFRWWPLSLVCLVPLGVVVTRAPLARAVALGMLHGAVLNAWAFHWTVPAIVRIRDFSPVVAGGMLLALSVAHGCRFALLSLLHAWATARGVRPFLALPLAAVTSELVCPMLFPWHIGFLAGAEVTFMQLAELGGPLLTTLWVATVNGCFVEAWLERTRRGSAVRALAVGAGVVSSVTGLGHALLTRANALAERFPPGRVGLVQHSSAPSQAAPDPFRFMRDESARLLAREPALDLLIWPETSVTTPVAWSQLADLTRRLHRGAPPAAPPIPAALLAGFVVDEGRSLGTSSPERRTFNSAVLSSGDGEYLARYDKRALVVFGERSPLRGFPALGPATPFEPGSRAPVLPFGRHNLSLSICYEDMLEGSFRASVTDDTDLLVNLTSDQWFTGSAGPSFHVALAAYRAVEHRRYLVRATTTGVTTVIAPTGRSVWTLPEGVAGAGVSTVRWIRTKTLYEMLGDWPFALAPLGLLLAVRSARGGAGTRAPERQTGIGG